MRFPGARVWEAETGGTVVSTGEVLGVGVREEAEGAQKGDLGGLLRLWP